VTKKVLRMWKLKCEGQFAKHENETFVVPLAFCMFVSREIDRNKVPMIPISK